MEPVSLYKETYHVDLGDVDFQEQLRLSKLFTHFQDVASLASINLGFGIHTLGEKFGVAWILMRIRVDIIRNPVLDEDITIETWPLEPKKLEFNRDYIVRDQEGNIIVRAISTWVIMDIEERKLKRTSTIGFTFPESIEERAIDSNMNKLKHAGELEVSYKKVIGYSDIDFNGHLNNSRYVDYIMDSFNLDEHRKYRIESLEVHYLNEALPGENLVLYKGTSDKDTGQVHIEGVDKDDEHIVFKAQAKVTER